MKIEINRYLVEVYRPWGGAKAVYERMSDEELEKIEEWFNQINEPFSEIEINDFFWFDDSTVLEIIGENEENFYNRPRRRWVLTDEELQDSIRRKYAELEP